MRTRRKPAVLIGAGLVAAAMAGGGYFIVDRASDSSCEEQVANAAERQAELIEQLGSDAPNLDFEFPEECFELIGS